MNRTTTNTNRTAPRYQPDADELNRLADYTPEEFDAEWEDAPSPMPQELDDDYTEENVLSGAFDAKWGAWLDAEARAGR